jgi:hypothetical protein
MIRSPNVAHVLSSANISLSWWTAIHCHFGEAFVAAESGVCTVCCCFVLCACLSLHTPLCGLVFAISALLDSRSLCLTPVSQSSLGNWREKPIDSESINLKAVILLEMFLRNHGVAHRWIGLLWYFLSSVLTGLQHNRTSVFASGSQRKFAFIYILSWTSLKTTVAACLEYLLAKWFNEIFRHWLNTCCTPVSG